MSGSFGGEYASGFGLGGNRQGFRILSVDQRGPLLRVTEDLMPYTSHMDKGGPRSAQISGIRYIMRSTRPQMQLPIVNPCQLIENQMRSFNKPSDVTRPFYTLVLRVEPVG
jgi:hypothetical protein